MMHRAANQDAVKLRRRPRAWLELALVPVPAAGAGWLISAAGQTAYRDGLAGLYSGTDFSLFVAAVCITWAFLVVVGVRLLVHWRRLTLGGRAVRVALALAGLAGAITAGDYARDTYPRPDPFLLGWREHMRATADVPAIRAWARTLGPFADPVRVIEPADWPKSIADLGPQDVDYWDDGSVVLRWGGGFFAYYLIVGPAGNATPTPFAPELDSHYEVESGVYVCATR